MKSRNFEHLLGCGWRYPEGEDRHTPSATSSQRAIIKHCLNAAQKAAEEGSNLNQQVDEFVKHLLEELDNQN